MRETQTSIIINLRRHDGEKVEITWTKIDRITVFKQDLFNPQIVIMEIRSGSETWEVDAADCAGFETFCHILGKRLKGIPPYESWWPVVTDPLGRQLDVILYERAEA